jgi:hypothetical protein
MRSSTTRIALFVSLLSAFLVSPMTPYFTAEVPALGVPAAHAAESILTFTPAPLTPASDGVALQQLRIPAFISADVPFAIETTWQLTGAAVSESWEIVYQLYAADNTLAAELVSDLDLITTLQNDPPTVSEDFWVSPTMANGAYTLSILVRDPAGQRAPLALKIAGAQPDGSYPLGSVNVGAAPPEQGGVAAAAVVYLPLIRETSTEAVTTDEPPPTANATVTGKSRGYLTTPQELQAIKQKADKGMEPYASNVRELLNNSSLKSATAWVSQTTISSSRYCSDGSQKDANGNTLPKGPIYLIEGSRLTYAKTLAAHLTTGSRSEALARDARARINDLLDTASWGGADYSPENQCILYLSWYMPSFVMAADLLESYPLIWTTSDKRAFQSWLARVVYPKVAWSSRARVNNWGVGGSYAATVIADYLTNSGLTLKEVAPVARSLSPGQAYAEHVTEQLNRMSTVVSQRDITSSRCLPYKGIQPGGGVPDELRRAAISDPLSLCKATYLPSITGSYAPANNYQQIHTELLVGHAEVTLRRGDDRIYKNIASDKSGSLLRAIKFIIQNPAKPSASYNWDNDRKAMLYIAYRYYRDSAIKAQLNNSALRSGHPVSYGRLTHGFASTENPGLPPTIAPPSP